MPAMPVTPLTVVVETSPSPTATPLVEPTTSPVASRLPLWPGTYRVWPWEKEKLTAADLPASDGVVYPDWRKAGLSADLKPGSFSVEISECGAIANDGEDDTFAFQEAVLKVVEKGGGSVLVGSGTWNVSAPVFIENDGVILKGKGIDETAVVLAGNGQVRFVGDGAVDEAVALAEDAARGARQLQLTGSVDWTAGDCVELSQMPSAEWCAKAGIAPAKMWPWTVRVLVSGVLEKTVALDAALRMPFSAKENAKVRRVDVVRHCALESMSLVSGELPPVVLRNALECRLKNLRITQITGVAVDTQTAMRCEISSLELSAAKKGRENRATFGWQRAWDCLAENVKTEGLRYAPVFLGATGCVVRGSEFGGSGAVWEPGWSTENLMENCVVRPRIDFGGHPVGLWLGPEGSGFSGPRNVIYNCALVSSGPAVSLAGLNEAWIFMHNLLVSGGSAGFVASNGSFDLVLAANTFSLTKPVGPAMLLLSRDCTGSQVVGNQIYGATSLAGGVIPPGLERDNTVTDVFVAADRPHPDIPSIFEYQRGKEPPAPEPKEEE